MVYKVAPLQCRSCGFCELGLCYNEDKGGEDYPDLAESGECPGYEGINEEIDMEGILNAG